MRPREARRTLFVQDLHSGCQDRCTVFASAHDVLSAERELSVRMIARRIRMDRVSICDVPQSSAFIKNSPLGAGNMSGRMLFVIGSLCGRP